ncbi:hypothetical protein CEXT_500991, partial [Caerostris extrusa]
RKKENIDKMPRCCRMISHSKSAHTLFKFSVPHATCNISSPETTEPPIEVSGKRPLGLLTT